MKRALIIAVAFGAGIAIFGIAGIALYAWWNDRPKPWNVEAITAQYEGIDTRGEERQLVFSYTLKNNTGWDFRISSDAEIHLTAKLERSHSLAGEAPKGVLFAELPVFLPAGHSVRLNIHLGGQYNGPELPPTGASKEDRMTESKILAAFIRDKYANLDGFVLFHEPTRYEIDFPNGWSHQEDSK